MKLPALGFISRTILCSFAPMNGCIRRTTSTRIRISPTVCRQLPAAVHYVVGNGGSVVAYAGREQALKVLRTSAWDGGIVSEGVDPTSAVMDSAGRAFATAAGYVAHAICQNFCSGQ